MSNSKFYTYVLLDPRKQGRYSYEDTISFLFKPFYVGKGIFERCYDHAKENKKNTHNLHKFYTIQKIKNSGTEPVVLKINEDITEQEANILEQLYIKIIGRADIGLGPLTNLTFGGEGGGKMRNIKISFVDGDFTNITELSTYISKNFNVSMWRNAHYYIKQFPNYFIKNDFYKKYNSALQISAFVELIKEYKNNLKYTEEATLKRLNKIKVLREASVGQNNPMYGKKRSEAWCSSHSNFMLENNPRAKKVIVRGVYYNSIKEAMRKEKWAKKLLKN